MSLLLLRLQKNVFLLVLVSVIFLGMSLAFLTATVAGMFLSDSGPVGSAARPRSRVIAGTAPKPFETYAGILTGNLFQGRASQTREAGAPPDVKDVVLHGVLAGSRSFARAIIQIKGENEIREYATLESAGGNRILEIFGNSVLLDRGGQRLELQVGQDTSNRPAPPAAQEGAPPTAGATKITVQRSRISALMQDPAAMAKAKMAPVTVGNKTVGVKLIYVPNDSIFFELGARTGDIIRRVNGQPLSGSGEKLLELMQGLRTLDKFSVEVERSGRILPFEILIQN